LLLVLWGATAADAATTITLLVGGGPVLHVACAPLASGGAYVAAATADGSLRQWRVALREGRPRASAHVTASLLPLLEGLGGPGGGAVVARVELLPRAGADGAEVAPAALLLGPPPAEAGAARARAAWAWDADAGAWAR
jgi:hypothetical protein